MMESGRIVVANRKELGDVKPICLTPDDVITLRLQRLDRLPSDQGVALKYGLYLMPLGAFLPNLLALAFFRKQFKLNKGLRGTVVPVVAFNFIPAVASSLAVQNYFRNHLLTLSSSELTECLLCRELKATLMQLTMATFTPIAGFYAFTCLFAAASSSYSIPTLTKTTLTNARERKFFVNDMKNVFKKTTRSFSRTFAGISLASFVCTNMLLYWQQKEFFQLEESLSKFSKSQIEALVSENSINSVFYDASKKTVDK